MNFKTYLKRVLGYFRCLKSGVKHRGGIHWKRSSFCKRVEYRTGTKCFGSAIYGLVCRKTFGNWG